MHNTSVTVLTLLIAWALLLVVVMELLRARLVMSGAIAGTEFRPDNRRHRPRGPESRAWPGLHLLARPRLV